MTTQEDQLRHILFQSLSPDKSTRQAAESALLSSQSNPGHALVILRVVAASCNAGGEGVGGSYGGLPVRQAAAVHFKNMVKGGWGGPPSSPNDGGGDDVITSPPKFIIPESDRELIKNNLVSLMCTVPPALQSQCSESVALIAAVDFPQRWDNLLPDLIAKFAHPDWNIVNGVLLTANSILKRFRFVQRSDALYADILYVLQRIQEPLTQLFVSITAQLDTTTTTTHTTASSGDNILGLTARLAALRSINRIFYSLNYQDLPEYFEDHMNEWMAGFAKLLQYTNPILVDEDEEMQPGELGDMYMCYFIYIRENYYIFLCMRQLISIII